MPRNVTVDFETYSEAGFILLPGAQGWAPEVPKKPGLKGVGLARYARHPSTEILSLAYDFHDARGPKLWVPGMRPPEDLFAHIAAGGLVNSWKMMFEWMIWRHVARARMGWPELHIGQIRCDMARAAVWGLPSALKDAGKVLAADSLKDSRGEALIRRLCIPRKPTKKNPALRLTPDVSPADFGALYEYNLQDVVAERSIADMLPEMPESELAVWQLDQRINARGVAVDMPLVDACLAIVEQTRDKLTARLRSITGIADLTVDQLGVIKSWAASRGVRLDSLDAEHVAQYLSDPLMPLEVADVIGIRASLASKSVDKLKAVKNTVSSDGRLHELFAYCGAKQTGRWAGRGPQPQNMPSGGPDVVECSVCGKHLWAGRKCCGETRKTDWGLKGMEAAIADIMTGDLAHVESRWGDALKVVSGCIRGVFVAAPGHELISSDYSAIEAVVLAELAGEEWRREVFRTHGKIYETSASRITGTPFEEFLRIKKETGNHHELRKLGKVAELASGYKGWIRAWKNFGADEFLTDEEIKNSILAWHAASPMIVEFWGGQWRKDPKKWKFTRELYGVEGAAVSALLNPGKWYSYRDVAYIHQGRVLYCRLPSGRMLTYWDPWLSPGKAPHGNDIWTINYYGWNSDSSKGPVGWIPDTTHGGKLTENIVQAVSRDLLAPAMLALESAGYPVVMHVHDEVVAEIPEGGQHSVEEFERIMMTVPAWAQGWAVKAAGGWRGHRYRKG